MNWHIGQKVVCVKEDWGLVKDKEYTITKLWTHKCTCGETLIIEVGVPLPPFAKLMFCKRCGTESPVPASAPYGEENFRPLDSTTDELSDYTPYSLIRELDKTKIRELTQRHHTKIFINSDLIQIISS